MPEPLERLKAALAGHYRIERELGAGGMATVYLAEDLKHDRQVAIKVLRPDLVASLGPERFLREVKIAANLQHPHVLPLYDSGQADGLLYYVMPYVEGTNLRQKLMREGELPIGEAVRILRDVADAMAYAHRHGVVHRDIKPENVMLSDHHALVTDFGVAKAVSEATGRQSYTTAGVALGTPAYMSPEQAVADPHTDHRADIYAFGVVAYELLTGRPPFTGANAQAILSSHMIQLPDPLTRNRPSIPPALAALVMRCLEKKPADRWQHAEELIAQLEAVLTPSGGMAPAMLPPGAVVNPPGARRVTDRRWGLLAGLTLVAIGAAGIWYWRTKPVPLAPGRVAVLPLENRTGDATLNDRGVRLAEAMTEAIGREGVGEPVAVATIGALAASRADQAALARRVSQRTGAELIVRGAYHKAQAGVEVGVEVLRMPTGEQRFAFSVAGQAESDALRQALAERTLVALTLEKEWGPGVSWQGEYLPKSMKAVREYLRSMEVRQDTTWVVAAHEAYRADSAWTYAFWKSLLADLGWPNLDGGDASGGDQGQQGVPRRTAWEAGRAALEAFERRTDLTQGDQERVAYYRAWLGGDLEGRFQAMKRLFARRPTEYAGGLAREAWLTLRFRQAVDLRKVLGEPGFWTAPSHRVAEAWDDIGFALHMLGRYREEAEIGRYIRREFPDKPLVGMNHEMRAAIGLGDTTRAERLVDELERNLSVHAYDVSRAIVAGLELAAHGHGAGARAMYERSVRTLEERMAAGDTSTTELNELAEALMLLGRDDKLAQISRGLLARGDSIGSYYLAGTLAVKGRDRAGVALADARLAGMRFENPYVQSTILYTRAELAALHGDRSRAIDLLRAAFRSGYADHFNWHTDPDLTSLRGTPAFEELTRPRDP